MEKRIKLMVFGKSGAGKSQSLNLICGLQKDQQFKVAQTPESFTQKCEQYDGTLFGENKMNITAIDVPGIYDTKDVLSNQQQEPISLIHLKAIGNFVRDNWQQKINKVILCIEATEKARNTQIKNIISILKKIVVDPSDIFVFLTKCQVAQQYVNYWIQSLHDFGLQYIFKVGDDFEEDDKKDIQRILQFQIEKKLRFWEDFSLFEKIEIAQMFNFQYQEASKGCFSQNMKITHRNGKLYGPQEILQKEEYKLMLNENTFLGYIHFDTISNTRFLCLKFINSENLLEITDNHLIFCSRKQNGDIINKFIKAKELKKGDSLISYEADQQGNVQQQELQISQISTEIKQGFWCPLTSTGQLIVNSILVSAYDVSLNELVSQDQAHLAMMPLILYRQLLGFNKQNTLLNKKNKIQSKYQIFGTNLVNLLNQIDQ